MSDDDDDAPAPAKKTGKKATWVRGAEASSIGIELAISICVPMIGAHYLERHVTHWSPWTTLVGVVVGLAIGANALTRTARDYQRSLRADAAADEDADPPKDDPE